MHRATLLRCLLAASLMAGGIAPACATWSIAVVNPHTGTIGVAAASCSGGVWGIQSVVPGRGVVIVQAASNRDARNAAVRMMRDGAPLDTILAHLVDPASGYDPADQQIALLASGPDARARTHTGADVPDVSTQSGGTFFTVQGNTLASSEVVRRAAAALGKPGWRDDLDMAKALLLALQGVAKAGGDRRCGASASNTALLSLHRATDPADAPWVSLSVNRIPTGAASGTDALTELFEDWQRNGRLRPSTAIFVVPRT